MTVLGVGIDLVEISRVETLLAEHGGRAMGRLLSAEERAYCEAKARPAQHVAARVAAKEAAYKALAGGGDVGYLPWLDVEVTRDSDGRPALAFHGAAHTVAERLGVRHTHVSLTHSHTHAAAVVMLVG